MSMRELWIILSVFIALRIPLPADEIWRQVQVSPDGPIFEVPPGAEIYPTNDGCVFHPRENWADDFSMHASAGPGGFWGYNTVDSFELRWKATFQYKEWITWSWK